MADGLGKGQPHDCKHRKMLFSLNRDPYYTATVISSPKIGVATWDSNGSAVSPYNSNAVFGNYLNWNLTNLTNPPGWSISSPSPSQEVRLKEDVIEKAKGLTADVVLNIVEANQIWPSLNSLTRCLPEMGANWRDLRKVIRTASGGFLAWKFGVSPILQDTIALVKYAPKMKSDVDRFLKQDSNKFSSLGNLVASFLPVDDSFSSTDDRFAQGLVTGNPVVRYVLVVKPNQKYLTKAFAAMANAMERFASSPASLAWEKIPFSFVVDWFVDMRGALREIDSALGVSPYQVVSFTRSLSYHLESQKFWRTKSPCSGGTLFDVRIGTAEYKHYERLAVSMGGSPPTWIPRFGKNQAGISAALISQQLSKLK
jgi:hypothetical protein